MFDKDEWVIDPHGRKILVVRKEADIVTCEWPENGKLQNGRFRVSELKPCEPVEA